MTVYGYARVSTSQQADEGESLGVQQRQIEGWALIAGEPVGEVFIDRGVSGSVPLANRPEGGKLVKMARKGDTIVAARLDRLFRSALDALKTVEAMASKGVRVVVIEGLGDITNNGMAKAFLTISAAFAELERDTIRERVQTVKNDQRQRQRYLGGKRPYGFDIVDGGLQPNPDEQAIIAFIVQRSLAGDPLRKISDAIPASFPGHAISKNAVHRILKENNVISDLPG